MNTRSFKRPNKVIVIGASAGGVHALKTLVSQLSPDFPHAVIVVLHRLKNVTSRLDVLLQSFTRIPVSEVEDKEDVLAGRLYLCPANYHLLLEPDYTFSLSVSEKVNFSRPSIDVSFVSLAEAFGKKGIGVLLTGANQDGAEGLLALYEKGGRVVIQNPETAQVAVMPKAGVARVPKATVLHLEEIPDFISNL